MLKSKIQPIAFALLSITLLGCAKKPEPKSEIEVQSGATADITKVTKEHQLRFKKLPVVKPEPEVKQPEIKEPEVKVPEIKVPEVKTQPTSEITNPIHENATLTQVFQAYTDSGIDDPNMDVVLEKLKEENLSAEDLKVVMDKYFSILENPTDGLKEKLSLHDRLKSIFDMYASNTFIQDTIKKRVTPEGVLGDFSEQELKVIAPLQYATQLYTQLKKTPSPWPIPYSSTDTRDGKKYRTIIFGRIDFSKGVKKKSLDDSDKKEIEALSTIWSALLSSNPKPSNLSMKIVGFADRDKPANAEKNMANGLKRAQMVYDAFATNDFLKEFKVETMGDTYPLVDIDAKSPKNRRAEIFIFHREIREIPKGNIPVHKHDDDSEEAGH